MTPERPEHPAYRALLAAADGLIRDVLELHKPEGRWRSCKGCDQGSYAEDDPDWPCRTTELIAERLGIPLDERRYTLDGTARPTPAALPS